MASDPFFTDDLRHEEAKEVVKTSAASIKSTDTEDTLVDNTSQPFVPGRSLIIHTRGHNLVRLPLPPSELEICIFNQDGSPAYVSKRGKRFSGDAVLSSTKLGHLISTSYFFGPNRDPIIRQLDSPDASETGIKVSSSWASKTQSFTMPDGSRFEWSYFKIGKGWKKERVLVLDKIESPSVKKRVAQLTRNDETRTPGTKRTTAGNGGELILAQNAFEMLDEAMIVATCLLMLKKEVDRMRMVQFAVLTGGGGGG